MAVPRRRPDDRALVIRLHPNQQCGKPYGSFYFLPVPGAVQARRSRARPQGRGRLRYVPAPLAGMVRRSLRRGEQAEAVLAEISAINAELLARRELQ